LPRSAAATPRRGWPADIRLYLRHLAGLQAHHDRIGVRRRTWHAQHLRGTCHVAAQIAPPQRIYILEEAIDPHSDRIDRSHIRLHVVLALKLEESRCQQIGVRRAERPEQIVGQRHDASLTTARLPAGLALSSTPYPRRARTEASARLRRRDDLLEQTIGRPELR
jgi:hypothetical protein